MPSRFAIITICSYLFSLVLIRWVLLTGKRQSQAAVAWIMVIFMLPLLGGLLFLVFGINRVARRAAGKELVRRKIGPTFPALTQFEVLTGDTHSPLQARMMRLIDGVNAMRPTVGNRVDVLDDTNRTLALIEKAIESARETLHLEYYIWQPDRTGTRLRDRLIKKAKQGVKVRFLYDGVGSLRLSRRFLKPMREAGIQVAAFIPGRTFMQRWSINLRSHRKIVIVDGELGFTGGMNIGDEYIGKDPRLGYWRDTHLQLQGPVVSQLQQVFVEDWNFATNEELLGPSVFPPPVERGNVIAQTLVGEPIGDVTTFHTVMFAAINEARKSVTLATSYFVPPESLISALETAAHRGVKVRLLLSGRAELIWTVLAGRSYYASLLRSGVEIYEYRRGLMHAKTLTIDGEWSLVGTPNFDARSLLLNFEVGVATYDERIATQLEEQFERDLATTTRIELESWKNRGELQILAENACRLFAPVL